MTAHSTSTERPAATTNGVLMLLGLAIVVVLRQPSPQAGSSQRLARV